MNAINEPISQSELFTLASQLYVRVRRSTGRIVDAVYMAQNESYAREILAIASRVPDVELLTLVTRYENLLNQGGMPAAGAAPLPELELPAFDQTLPLAPAPRQARVPTPPPAPAPVPVAKKPVAPPEPEPAAGQAHTTEEEVAAHYIGALR